MGTGFALCLCNKKAKLARDKTDYKFTKGKQMKKKLYYVMPFILVPTLMLLCEVLDNAELLKMNIYILSGILVLSSAFFGFLSPSNKSIDYLSTLIMPLSFFCFMFVVGFLGEDDMGGRFHIYKAVDAAFQPIALILYLAMAMITLIASLKCFRNLKNSAKS